MKRPQYDSNNLCTGCQVEFGAPCAPDCRHNDVKPRRGRLAGRTQRSDGRTDTVRIHDTIS